MALDKRNLFRADHMNHQRLRPDGFDKPAGLEGSHEKRPGCRIAQSRIKLSSGKQRTDDEIHNNVGYDIKHRAGRPDDEHKAADGAGIPGTRLLEKLLVHIVPGDRGAGDIINQVQQQQLQRSHRQERQKSTGSQHGKHVAEVGGSRQFDVFDHVGISLPPFDHTVIDNVQILFQQHDIRGFLGDIHRGINRNPDIRNGHRGCVVDPVTHIADRMTGIPQQGNHPGFLRG